MKLPKPATIFAFVLLHAVLSGYGQENPAGGPSQKTPSKSQYFTWINNTNEGATHDQTMVNLEFFEWLSREYGMKLDIYAFDAGAIDGSMRYGSMNSDLFRKQFPYGFKPISDRFALMGTQLGLWCGPDGFGNTPEEAKARSEMMISLCRDYNFSLFKMDGVCGPLRKEKWDEFDRMMTECRKYEPGLILLNHRLDLGPGTKHATTFLLGGDETYIDVHMTNDFTASHHRAKALKRDLPDSLTRLTEDHGVCISSCLDYWEDDLILQAFNRNLIVSPQIYGNPWLLSDEEFPYLAYIYNLHRQYRDILVDGLALPKDVYGDNAVSRGDAQTRMITMSNITWESRKVKIDIGSQVGLTKGTRARVRQYHPYILDLGVHDVGSTVEIEIPPFRAVLVKITTADERDRVIISGIPYRIVQNIEQENVAVDLLGKPGKSYNVTVRSNDPDLKTVVVEDGHKQSINRNFRLNFAGEDYGIDYHRFIGKMMPAQIPSDVEALYYATVFAADNNALEVRSLKRSGKTNIPEVQRARDAFFDQQVFVERECWDKYLFDNDHETCFSVNIRWGDQRTDYRSEFCLDMGESLNLDKITVECPEVYSLSPLKPMEGINAFVSNDLRNWDIVPFITGKKMEIDLSKVDSCRYIRFGPTPLRISEIVGCVGGQPVNRSKWRANNLFRAYGRDGYNCRKVWKNQFVLDYIPKGSYLCVAINGLHGIDGAVVAFRIDGQYYGSPDRAPSFLSNTWEFRNLQTPSNNTFYLPLSPDMTGKPIEVYLLGMYPDKIDLDPQVWISAYPIPFESRSIKVQQ